MKYFIAILCLVTTPVLAQQKDRKDYLIDVMQASTTYSNNIAANCFADGAKQIDELKAKIKELEDKLNTDKK